MKQCEDCRHYDDGNPYGLPFCNKHGNRLSHDSVVCQDYRLPKPVIDIKPDKKGARFWTITHTDTEGFHRQLSVTEDEMNELVRLWNERI